MPFLIGQFTAVAQASFDFFFHGFNSFVLLFMSRQWTFFSVIPDRSTIILLQILIAGFVKRSGLPPTSLPSDNFPFCCWKSLKAFPIRF